MVKNHEDDLFKETAMTFGEHLEELRVALFKSVVSLAIGFGIGLFFANQIVQWIQAPLEIALTQFYKEEAVEYVNGHVPENMRNDEQVQKLVMNDGMEPQEVFLAPGEMLGELKKKYPKQFGHIELPRPVKPAAPETASSIDAAPSESAVPKENAAPRQSASAQPEPTPPVPSAVEQPTKNQDSTPTDPAKTDPAKTDPAKTDSAKTDPAQTGSPGQSTSASPIVTKDDMIRVFLWRPIAEDERLKVKSLNVQESFMIWLKAGFLAGALISSPLVFYFLWQFIAAGLYPNEKRYVHFFLPFSVLLFMSGALMAFFFVFPPVLNFFFGITKSMGQGIEPRISEWLSFVLLLPLGFGIAFQLPLVMLFLERIRVMSVAVYLGKWRIAVLIMAVASMLLSPGGDPYSMLMMLVPLIVLYFGGIGLCHWLPSNRSEKPDEVGNAR